jgi:outer membrane immunogenic protein
MRGAAVAVFALIAAPAFGADLPTTKSPPPPPLPTALNWTGAYVGVEAGYGWVGETQTFLDTDGFAVDPTGTTYNTNRSGFLGGFDAGYNYQIGQFVLGAEGSFDFTGIKGESVTNSILYPTLGLTVDEHGKTDWYATLTGRVGFAIDPALLYVKGGAVWSQQEYGGNVTLAGFAPTVYPNFNDTRVGWTIGTGVEYAFTKNVSAFAEYDYLDFGTKTYHITDSAGATHTTYSVKTDANLAKVGLNYRF